MPADSSRKLPGRKAANISVMGHRRAGNHYLAALIDLNFTKKDNYVNLFRKWAPHTEPWVAESEIAKDPDTLAIYIWRDFLPTARSMFAMRQRFGVTVNDFDEFLRCAWADMVVLDMKGRLRIHTDAVDVTRKARGWKRNKQIRDTPRAYWLRHITGWMELSVKYDNVLIVKYEDFMNYFQPTMTLLALRLGYPVKAFTKLTKRVGFQQVGATEVWAPSE